MAAPLIVCGLIADEVVAGGLPARQALLANSTAPIAIVQTARNGDEKTYQPRALSRFDVGRRVSPRLAGLAPLAVGIARDASPFPSSVDLSADSPPVGSQGNDSSCVSWVVGYYMRGWYAKRDGVYPGGAPGGFAPMYLYSQITKGANAPTSFEATLAQLKSSGIDTSADYTQGSTNYAALPTAPEQVHAAPYAITNYSMLFQGDNQGASARQAIEGSLAKGDPVGLGIPVYSNFWNANALAYKIDFPVGTLYGDHAVVALKYDRTGVWVENEWEANWGLNGWVKLSWDYIERYAWTAVTIQPAAHIIAATPVSTATPLLSTTAPVPASTPTNAAPTTSPSNAAPIVITPRGPITRRSRTSLM